jgi:hypothetical protein
MVILCRGLAGFAMDAGELASADHGGLHQPGDEQQ